MLGIVALGYFVRKNKMKRPRPSKRDKKIVITLELIITLLCILYIGTL
jgi:hypothetical protein